MDVLREANYILRFAREMTPQDVIYTASIAELSVQSAVDGVYPLDRSIGREVVKLADKLLDINIEVLQEAEDACLRYVLQYYNTRLTFYPLSYMQCKGRAFRGGGLGGGTYIT